MNELDLYKFIQENSIEMRWDDEVLSTWVPPYHIPEFTRLIYSALSDGGIDVRLLQGGYIWLDLVPFCDRYDINPERICPKTTRP